MELGQSSSAKLEPFLLMSKSAKGAAAAKLIQDVTTAPGLFVFAELLDLPSIQDLANHPQHASHLSLLQLFSYKTYPDYIQTKNSLPALNPAQITKLKLLTLVSLAAERRILPYSDLMRTLETPTIRALEDLIIDAIYLDILRGKLDQKAQQLEVEYTMGRDLAPGKLNGVLAALQSWAGTTAGVLSTLDSQLGSLTSDAATRAATSATHETTVAKRVKEIQEKRDKGGAGKNALARSNNHPSLGADMDAMDVDDMPDPIAKGKGRRAPRGGQDENAVKQRLKRNRF